MVRYGGPPGTSPVGDVINLGRARKRKQRAAEQQRADENAIRHGRTKAEKARERIEQARLHAAVDGARREPGPAPARPNERDERGERDDPADGRATDDEPQAPPTR